MTISATGYIFGAFHPGDELTGESADERRDAVRTYVAPLADVGELQAIARNAGAREPRQQAVGGYSNLGDGTLSLDDGTVRQLDAGTLLAPLEVALRWLSWAIVALAIALVIARLT